MGGASDLQKNLAQEQQQFYQQATAEQEAQFTNQSELLDSLRQAWMPILQAGPNQAGFSPELDSMLKSQITDQGAQTTTNSVNAVEQREKQVSGGAPVLPTGANEQVEADAQVLGQQATAAGLQKETEANFEQGNQNFDNAANVFNGISAQENPVGYITAASGAGGTANSEANAVQQANEQGSFGGIVGGLLGGGIGNGIGSLIGKIPFCWVAAELFGLNSPEFFSLRSWILRTWYMKPFALFYSRYGERWAAWIRVNMIARKVTYWLFNLFLKESL